MYHDEEITGFAGAVPQVIEVKSRPNIVLQMHAIF